MLERVRKKMKEEDIETLAVTDKFNFLYIFGLEISGYAFITQNTVEMILPRFYRYEKINHEARFVFAKDEYLEEFQKLDYKEVYSENPGLLDEEFEVKDTSLITEMRKKKTQREAEKLRKAAEITDEAIQNIKPQLVGQTELEAVSQINQFYAKKGVEESFLTDGGISLVQTNSLRPHRPPQKKKIQESDLVIVDTGARYQKYCGDVTRTYCENPNEKQLELFNAVKSIQEELIEMIHPGLPISKWKKKEFELVKEYGFDPENHVLYFGHNIGLEVHEPPTLTHSTEEKFQEGMVFTVEPGLHVEGLGGVRIEDTVYLKEDTEILSSAPRKL